MIFGGKKPQQMGPPWGMGPPVELVSTVPLQGMAQSLMIEARQHPGFGVARIFLADAIDNRAESLGLIGDSSGEREAYANARKITEE